MGMHVYGDALGRVSRPGRPRLRAAVGSYLFQMSAIVLPLLVRSALGRIIGLSRLGMHHRVPVGKEVGRGATEAPAAFDTGIPLL